MRTAPAGHQRGQSAVQREVRVTRKLPATRRTLRKTSCSRCRGPARSDPRGWPAGSSSIPTQGSASSPARGLSVVADLRSPSGASAAGLSDGLGIGIVRAARVDRGRRRATAASGGGRASSCRANWMGSARHDGLRERIEVDRIRRRSSYRSSMAAPDRRLTSLGQHAAEQFSLNYRSKTTNRPNGPARRRQTGRRVLTPSRRQRGGAGDHDRSPSNAQSEAGKSRAYIPIGAARAPLTRVPIFRTPL